MFNINHITQNESPRAKALGILRIPTRAGIRLHQCVSGDSPPSVPLKAGLRAWLIPAPKRRVFA